MPIATMPEWLCKRLYGHMFDPGHEHGKKCFNCGARLQEDAHPKDLVFDTPVEQGELPS